MEPSSAAKSDKRHTGGKKLIVTQTYYMKENRNSKHTMYHEIYMILLEIKSTLNLKK